MGSPKTSCVLERLVRTDRESFAKLFEKRPRARIVVE